ncbi:MAG: hypothetical protein IKE03_04260, partial [Blautia sp.]|nr:hypothetical protein [Blautia sp.]
MSLSNKRIRKSLAAVMSLAVFISAHCSEIHPAEMIEKSGQFFDEVFTDGEGTTGTEGLTGEYQDLFTDFTGEDFQSKSPDM